MDKLTQKAIALMEGPFLRSATVLAVREWAHGTFREIDLHMPDCDMSKWDCTLHIKCKVGVLTYRDYTPSGWDAETRTCTLFIHVAHEGPGSRWARGLETGHTLFYLGVSSSHQQPVAGKRMILLGDETAIGHFWALRQLTGAGTVISGAIVLGEKHHQDEFRQYFPGWGLQSLERECSGDYTALEKWVEGLMPADPTDSIVYLAGHVPSVVRLRKLLRKKGFAGSRVRAQGFWQ